MTSRMTCQSLICGVRSVSTVILGSKCVSEGHDAPSMRPAHTPCPSDRQVRLRQWLGRTTHTTSRFERPGPIRICLLGFTSRRHWAYKWPIERPRQVFYQFTDPRGWKVCLVRAEIRTRKLESYARDSLGILRLRYRALRLNTV